MHVLGAVGPGAADLLERLAGRLDGRVATVESVPSADVDGVDGPADASFELGDGAWSGRGTGRSLSGLLDRLAPDYDYALLLGFPEARVPTVALGDADARKELLAAADVGAVDADDLTASLADTEPWVTLESLVERIKAVPDADRAGAIATFTGRVRAKDAADDSPTTHPSNDGRIATVLRSRDGLFVIVCQDVAAAKTDVFGWRPDAEYRFSSPADTVDQFPRLFHIRSRCLNRIAVDLH